jgi:hypothetical protein
MAAANLQLQSNEEFFISAGENLQVILHELVVTKRG